MNEHDRLRCEDVLEHLFGYLDGELDAEKRAQIDRHLEECRGCFSRAEFEKALRERIGQLGEDKAPESLKQRVRSLIDQF